MKTVKYGNHNLAKNSRAFELLQDYEKASGTEKNEAKKKLDQHLKEVDLAFKKLHGI